MITKTIKALTYEYVKYKNCYRVRFGGRIFTTAVQAQKKGHSFSWAKNTARGVCFLLTFNMYLFLAQCEQVYLFLALAKKYNIR